jgi:hypothetical protein
MSITAYYSVKSRLTALSVLCFYILAAAVFSQVHELNLIQPVHIAEGETLNISDIVDQVMIDGENTVVSINYPDTSVLASGRHTLVFTAETFTGKTECFETTLDVGNSDPLRNIPVIRGIENYHISCGKLLDLKLNCEAFDSNNNPIEVFTNITSPEHLSPGIHSIYYTAVDSDGKSCVEKITLTADEVPMNYRRYEWAELGRHLYNKYFEPERYENDLDGAYPYFIYSTPDSTEPGIQILMFFENTRYDYFSFDSAPLKIESLMARLILLLKELRHHRYLWIDQPQIVISLSEFMPFQITDSAGKIQDVHKDRGIYGLTIPKSVFMKSNFDKYVSDTLKRMSEQPLNEPTRRIRHHMFLDNSTGIKVLYYQMHSGTLFDEYKTRIESGEVTIEENFDYNMFLNEYNQCKIRFISGEFGRFTNPKAPLLNYEVKK